jgi:hypothetical protein
MVLLQAEKNTQIGSKSFDTKKNTFKGSEFILTSQITEYNSWGIKEIEDRQKNLAELAVKTWPI